jgi:dTDP-4-amino-4,6-dideoxygalactose transaminase
MSWRRYHEMLEPLEIEGVLRRPVIPKECEHNGHMYYVLLSPNINRQHVLDEFKKNQIAAIFHYVPLHSSPAGIRFGRNHGSLDVTNQASESLIRLPLWAGISEEQQRRVVYILRGIS